MNGLIILSCVFALAAADPGLVGHAPVAAVATSVSSQYHAQDELGQYSYGYAGGPSAKQEVRTADGITRGGYSYIDGHGLVQSASYVSDPVNGFRVAATNLPVGPGAPAAPVAVAAPAPVAVAAAPAVTVNAAFHAAAPVAYAAPAAHAVAAPVAYAGPAAPLAFAAAPGHLAAPVGVVDTPEVTAAKIAHASAHLEAKSRLLGRKKRGIVGPVAAPAVAAYAAPAVHAYAAPAVAVAPARSFAYSTVSAHADLVAHAAPAVAVHAAPAPVAVHAAAPVAYAAPAAPLAFAAAPGHLAAPVGVVDTPEVTAAKIAHAAAHHEAKARLFGRKKRGIVGPVAAPAVAAYAAPAFAAHAVAAPAVVSVPSRSFAYSTVSAATVPVAAPAVAAYAAPAYAAPAPAVAAYAAPAIAAPAAHAVVAAPAVGVATSVSSQFQAQDTLGQYSYGYSDINSAKTETRAFDGSTHGSYSYVDGNGLVQSVKYHADALGFRAAGTNIPISP